MNRYSAVIALAAILAAPVHASDTLVYADGQGNVLTLLKTPCTNKALEHVLPQHKSIAKTAIVLYQGKTYDACWAITPQMPGVVQFIDEENEGNVIPLDAFSAPAKS